MRFARGLELAARSPSPAAARPVSPHRPRATFLAAVEGNGVAEDLRRLLAELVETPELEVIPQDGPIALARLRSTRPRLAFVSMDLKLMEGLTLLRALPAGRGRQIVLLVPDTVEGYRRAWDGLYFGARDFLVTRGSPPQRFKGRTSMRLRQLSHLLAGGETPGPDAVPGFEGSWEVVSAAGASTAAVDPRAPWVVLAESRHLPAVVAWLRRQPPDVPVLLRVPEGAKFQRVAREGLGRLLCWPVRIVSDGDRLVPGHVHLIHDGQVPWVEHSGEFPRVREVPQPDPPGSWCAQMTLISRLAASTVGLRVLLPEADPSDREELLSRAQGRHEVFHLVPAAGAIGLRAE
jgi:chemotaxis response regulator CheB